MSIETGVLCYFQCPKRSWTVGTVVEWDDKKKVGSCKAQDTGEVVAKMGEHNVMVTREELLDENVDDLLHLTLLHDATILDVLKRRYLKDIIYTNIGAIVVALNPFNFKIPWYTDDNMPKYLEEGDRIEQNLPHSWAVAHNTYWEMMNDDFNQCILVSGESGAGKTEASKIVMKYLAALSCKSGNEAQKQAGREVGVKINKSSPPLESYGNAKTVRNDNSSRFGKFMKVKFSSDGFLRGAYITKYLLEKSRIVTASPGERVYHSFYLLLRGKDAGKYSLGDQKLYRSVSAGKQWDNKEFNSAEEYDEVCEAMSTIGIAGDQINGMWSVVGGILHLLNIDFTPEGEGSAINPNTLPDLNTCLDLWRVDKATFQRELTSTELDIGGQLITRLLTPVKAVDGRDALVKALYDCEFGWLVEKCNEMLDIGDEGNWIGLLDIFGFEDFEINSFEQFCINLANETLQGHYNQFIFTRDMAECRAEGIDVADVEFPDNSPCLKMMVGKGGISALLDEECALGKGSDDGFLQKIVDAHAKNPFFQKKALQKSSFTIHHYAGSVSYEVQGFLEKNRDTLKDSMKLLMRASEDGFVAGLLPAPVEKSGPKLTVGGFFKSQLKDLMDLINSTNPHWIRCVKPHPAKKPLMLCGVSTMHQLASAGVLGTVKIRKAGFPVRIRFEDFVARYGLLLSGVPDDPRAAAVEIITAAGVDPKRAQAGKTRVFLKSDAYVAVEQAKRDRLAVFARTVQAFARALEPITAAKRVVYEKNKTLVESLRGFVKSVIRVDTGEQNGRLTTAREEDAQWNTMLSGFNEAARDIDYERIAALERALEAQRSEERGELEEEWFEHAVEVLEDEDRLRQGLMNMIEAKLTAARRQEQIRAVKAAEEATKRAHQAKLEERKQRAEVARASKELKESKIKAAADKEARRQEAAEERRLAEMRQRRQRLVEREAAMVAREEQFQMNLQRKGRLGGGKILTEEEKEERGKKEWAKLEAVRRKTMLNRYTRQTWEEMRHADQDFERTVQQQELQEKRRRREEVVLKRDEERKRLLDRKSEIEKEQLRMTRELERIRNRDTEAGKMLVKEKNDMRKRAEQREWQLLQEYFSNQKRHASMERQQAAENFSRRRIEHMTHSSGRQVNRTTERGQFIPLCDRVGSPEPFQMANGQLSVSPR